MKKDIHYSEGLRKEKLCGLLHPLLTASFLALAFTDIQRRLLAFSSQSLFRLLSFLHLRSNLDLCFCCNIISGPWPPCILLSKHPHSWKTLFSVSLLQETKEKHIFHIFNPSRVYFSSYYGSDMTLIFTPKPENADEDSSLPKNDTISLAY